MAPSTMKDIAAHAGVSKATVSRVVNNDPNVAADLRARPQGYPGIGLPAEPGCATPAGGFQRRDRVAGLGHSKSVLYLGCGRCGGDGLRPPDEHSAVQY